MQVHMVHSSALEFGHHMFVYAGHYVSIHIRLQFLQRCRESNKGNIPAGTINIQCVLPCLMDDSFPQDYCLTCQGSGVVDGMKHVKLDMPAGIVYSASIAFSQFVSFVQISVHAHKFRLFGLRSYCVQSSYILVELQSHICVGSTGNFPQLVFS